MILRGDKTRIKRKNSSHSGQGIEVSKSILARSHYKKGPTGPKQNKKKSKPYEKKRGSTATRMISTAKEEREKGTTAEWGQSPRSKTGNLDLKKKKKATLVQGEEPLNSNQWKRRSEHGKGTDHVFEKGGFGGKKKHETDSGGKVANSGIT